jgi:hypothetical protein
MGKIYPALPRIPSLQLCFDASKTGFGIGSRHAGYLCRSIRVSRLSRGTDPELEAGE